MYAQMIGTTPTTVNDFNNNMASTIMQPDMTNAQNGMWKSNFYN